MTKSTPGAAEGGVQERSPKGFLRRWWIPLLVIGLLVVGTSAYLIRSGKANSAAAKQQANAMNRATPVAAAAAKKGDMPLYLGGLGTVAPLNTVAVKSRVDGQLMEVLFREGQMVNSGELLAVIDPRPFQVQLTQAEGQMARDQALLKNSLLDLERYRVLWQQDSIPKQQFDTQEALVKQYEGTVKLDQGLVDNAKLQLTYCRITAPVSGRIGLRLVDPGNIVRATDTNPLVVITQLQPITVIFPIPEDSLQPVLAKLRGVAQLPVEAYDRQQKIKLATGSLLTIDNQIDPATGTVKLRAVFANKENELFPNQFVNARLLIDVKREVIIIPSPAIQRGVQGPYVYVITPERTVVVRPVTVDQSHGGETSITAGLSPGEVVVVDGADRLREGARVEVKGQIEGTPRTEGR
jgi:multidrug efflux system membrane fusion protein